MVRGTSRAAAAVAMIAATILVGACGSGFGGSAGSAPNLGASMTAAGPRTAPLTPTRGLSASTTSRARRSGSKAVPAHGSASKPMATTSGTVGSSTGGASGVGTTVARSSSGDTAATHSSGGNTAAPDTAAPDTAAAGAVVGLVNAARKTAGCPALKANAVLAAVALAHSTDMATAKYFSHNSPGGNSPFKRITSAGYQYGVAAENIAAGQPNADAVMTSWMNSPGHRANILDCSLTEIGVGVFRDPGSKYRVYWTQDFATPA